MASWSENSMPTYPPANFSSPNTCIGNGVVVHATAIALDSVLCLVLSKFIQIIIIIYSGIFGKKEIKKERKKEKGYYEGSLS
jgi:hypothetical protein